MDIRNFILVFYLNREINPPRWFTESTRVKMLEYKEKHYQRNCSTLLGVMFRQLKHFYPDATVHVLTNLETLPYHHDKLVIHYDEIPPTSHHVIKLKIYGLLDEPAMYLDTDVILTRRFDATHLDVSAPFNLYRYYEMDKIKKVFNLSYGFNSGVVWIKEPDKKIADDLFYIYKKYFSNQQHLDRFQLRAGNDEHALAVYIKENRLRMKIFEEINKPRSEIDNLQIRQYQSIHYTGYNFNGKLHLPLEYSQLFGKVL